MNNMDALGELIGAGPDQYSNLSFRPQPTEQMPAPMPNMSIPAAGNQFIQPNVPTILPRNAELVGAPEPPPPPSQGGGSGGGVGNPWGGIGGIDTGNKGANFFLALLSGLFGGMHSIFG